MLLQRQQITCIIYVICTVYFKGTGAPKPRLPIRPGLKASSDVPANLPLFETPTRANELPRRKDLNEVKLRRKLGQDLNEMWSSISEPSEDDADVTVPTSTSPWLQFEIDNLTKTYGSGYPEAASIMAEWLEDRVSCPVVHEWRDLGPLFWPRYVRYGHCVEKNCSWPSGMECFPNNFTTVNVLRWHCRNVKKASKVKRSKDKRKCRWFNVPNSVLIDCSCECPTI